MSLPSQSQRASGARGLQALLPATAANGALTGIRRDGAPIPFALSTIKGVTYAVFAAPSGSYVAEYGVDTAAPVISNVAAIATPTDATVTWTTNEPASSRVDFGLAPGALSSSASSAGLVQTHGVVLPGLTSGTTYYYQVVSVDAGGLAGLGPVLSFTTSVAPTTIQVTDTTAADFNAGSISTGARVTNKAGGEVELGSSLGADFNGAAVPPGWTVSPWSVGGGAVVSAGQVVVDAALLHTDALYTPGRSVEFVATFGVEGFQHAGLAVTFNESRWAIFSTGGGGALYARTHTGAIPTDTLIPGTWLNAPHRYRIDWSATSVAFSIDGTLVATHGVAIVDPMRPVVSDFTAGAQALSVDWIELTPPYASQGTFTSRVLDAGMSASWTSASWTSTQPAGTSVSLGARFGNTPQPDATWTPLQAIPAPGASVAQVSRYVQYQAVLISSGSATPSLADVTLTAGHGGVPAISVGDAAVAEGQSGTAALTFTLTLPSPAASEVRVDYATSPGTATAGVDYVPTTGTAVFAAGASSTTVVVNVLGDTTPEPDETVFLNLSAPVGASLGDAQGLGTILNDDQPTLSIAAASVAEGSGGATASFAVTLSAPATQTVSASFATTGGTATSGVDFQVVSSTVTLPAGTTSATITVPVSDDLLDEVDETFTVTLSSPIGATLGAAVATGTIVDNDPSPVVSIAAATVTESNATQNATFIVSLSTASGRTVAVSYATSNGTASALADYTASTGTVTFQAGETSKTVVVPVAGDTLDENDETFVVTLSAPVAATLGTAQANGTIVDEDPLPSLAIADVIVAEGNTGNANAVFTVTLSPVSGRSVTVNYATANGTAVAPADYLDAIRAR